MAQEMDVGEAMVSVGRFLDPMAAQMAKGLLESLGIEAVLQGENANALLSMAFRARLLVRRADEAAARQVLADTGDGMGSGEEEEELPDGD